MKKFRIVGIPAKKIEPATSKTEEYDKFQDSVLARIRTTDLPNAVQTHCRLSECQ
jgi:hypothetical protein